jgi:hypothetical protein
MQSQRLSILLEQSSSRPIHMITLCRMTRSTWKHCSAAAHTTLLLRPPNGFDLLHQQTGCEASHGAPRGAEEIWIPVLFAADREEQRVFSGAWLGYYQFTRNDTLRRPKRSQPCGHLSATNRHLKRSLSLFENTEVRSATWSRRYQQAVQVCVMNRAWTPAPAYSHPTGYEKAKRRSNDGIDVSTDTNESRGHQVGCA